MRKMRILIVVSLVISLILAAFQTTSAISAGCKTINDNHSRWAELNLVYDANNWLPLGDGLRFARHDRIVLSWKITFAANRTPERSSGSLSVNMDSIAPRTGFTVQPTGSATLDVIDEMTAQAVNLTMRLSPKDLNNVTTIEYRVTCVENGAIASPTPTATMTHTATPTPTRDPYQPGPFYIPPGSFPFNGRTVRPNPGDLPDSLESTPESPIEPLQSTPEPTELAPVEELPIEPTLTPYWEPTPPAVEQPIEPTPPPPVEPTVAPPIEPTFTPSPTLTPMPELTAVPVDGG
jgi:hypothetical protein